MVFHITECSTDDYHCGAFRRQIINHFNSTGGLTFNISGKKDRYKEI